MSEMTKAESIVQEIRNLNRLGPESIMVPCYDRYGLIICKVDLAQLVLPKGYYYNGETLTNKGNTGNNGYWSFRIQHK